jgi:CheY-like chemotaxis protein
MNQTGIHALVTAADWETTARGKNPNILVVDDDRVLLDLLRKVLEKFGFEVALAASGKDAIDQVQKFVPDVILLDIKMPGMDGITLLKKIKSHDPDVEVIIITGFASLDSAVEALKYGAFDYIKKPFDNLAQVVDAIRRAWERRRPRLEKRSLRTSLERTIYELKILYGMSRTIGYCSDQKEITTRVLETLNQILGYDLAISMLVKDSEPEELLLQVVSPTSSRFIEEAKRSLIDAFNSASRSNVSADTPFQKTLGRKNIRSRRNTGQEGQGALRIAQNLNSFLNVPLMNNGHLVGMINLSSHLDRAFGPDDIRLIYTVASQVPPAIQRLKGIKAMERTRMDKLTDSISEGVIMIDQNSEVVLANTVAQKILDQENPDFDTIQNTLGLDFKRFKKQSEKENSDLLVKETEIHSENYQVTASTIKSSEGTFMGFVIYIRESSKQMRS